MEKWLLGLLNRILTVISPDIRALVVEWIRDLEVKAKKTPNPWDDIFVAILKMLLLVETVDPTDIVEPQGD